MNITHINLVPPKKLSQYTPGDIAYVVVATILLWIMIPGCGLFYSGMARSKNALSLLLLSFWSMAVTSIQWYLIGYSLAFSLNGNPFIGDLQHAFLIGVYDDPYWKVATIPELEFCLYQGVTAALAPSLILGIVAERGRILPAVLFILIWTTFAYDVIASWSLNPNGWSFQLGLLDFGGGAPVHVPSGAAALAYALNLGPRMLTEENLRPHNMQSLFLGTMLIWFGSFGYNMGSSNAADIYGVLSVFVANLSGSTGAITWVILDYWTEKKLTAFGFCAGAVAGLVAILPGSGFVSPSSGVLYGFLAALACFGATKLKDKLNFDDTLDVFVLHGVSGIVGNIMTGIFAQKSYGGVMVRDGGWIDGHWMQVVYQLADTGAAFFWSFGVAYISLFIMNKIPCLRLRVSPEVELDGVDVTEVGMKCYEFVEGVKIIPSTIERLASLENGNGSVAERHESGLRQGRTTNRNHWF